MANTHSEKYTDEQLREMARQVLAQFPSLQTVELVLLLAERFDLDATEVIAKINELAK